MKINFKGTIGEVKIIDNRTALMSEDGIEIIACWIINNNSQIARANAQLITDAFNIRQQINFDLPELLERYNKAVELLEKSINDVTFLEEAKEFLKTIK